MKYREWKEEYISLKETEEDCWLCNWDIAERKSLQREQLVDEFPKYWQKFLKEANNA